MRQDVYKDMRELVKTIKDYGWDRKGIQYPEDMRKIADYAEKVIKKRYEKKQYLVERS